MAARIAHTDDENIGVYQLKIIEIAAHRRCLDGASSELISLQLRKLQGQKAPLNLRRLLHIGLEHLHGKPMVDCVPDGAEGEIELVTIPARAEPKAEDVTNLGSHHQRGGVDATQTLLQCLG